MTESKVQKAVFMMGLSPRHKGFYYISTALFKMRESGEQCVRRRVLMKQLPEGELEQEERCMRYAIQYAWDVNKGDIHRLFPNSKLPPSPSEFIRAMLWEMEDEE